MLELHQVSKRYGGKMVLHPLSLRFEAARTYVLIGPSGCGKSTLLRIMMGLIDADSGSVKIDGTPLTRDNLLEQRRKIGYVIQQGGLFPHLTAEQNVSLAARYLKWDWKRIAARSRELAELTHFPSDGLRRYPGQLSGGQQQRVSLMRALMLDPELLLLDEPLGALDAMIRHDLQQELRDIFRRLCKTVVLVTHDLNEAAYFADHVLLLRAGQVVQQGAVQELIDAPVGEFVTQFVNAQRAVWPGGD